MVKFKQFIFRGNTGSDVLAVRRAMKKMGHKKLAKHGRTAGPVFVENIKVVQKNHKLQADGVYGPKTHAIIAPHFDAYGRLLYRLAKKRHPKESKRQEAVAYALSSLSFAGEMVYTEGAGRSELFHRSPGDFRGAGADCSQFVSSIMHWTGIETVNDEDATGTLLMKGKHVDAPAFARLVVFGGGGGVHTGMFTRHEGGVWYLTEFGKQSAPDEISLPEAIRFFEALGHPGVRYLDFYE